MTRMHLAARSVFPRKRWVLCVLLIVVTAVTAVEDPRVEVIEGNDAFDRADLDHDGQLDRAEFASYIAAMREALVPFIGPVTLAHDEKEKEAGGVLRGNRPRLNAGSKFWNGFVASIFTIFATEVGDKTFFIAAILSMKKDRIVVFAGAIGALIVMTVLSVVMGSVASQFLPPHVTHYAGACLFVFFGCKMLYDAREMSSTGPSEELTEVEEELEGKKSDESTEAVEEGKADEASRAMEGMMKVFTQAFLLTFLAEWGDRSQIATVTLAASKDALGVTLGAILGHSVCTGVAVIGGKFLATRISERTVAIAGGVLFLIFAIHSFLVGPHS